MARWAAAFLGQVTLTAMPCGLLAAEPDQVSAWRYSPAEHVISVAQLSDLRPADWSYQALTNLIERSSCVAGSSHSSVLRGQAMTRLEAAALLNTCLELVSERTDELKLLTQEFQGELAMLKGRTDGLQLQVGELEESLFSATTKLTGIATFVVGANGFGGNSSSAFQHAAREAEGATTFNYDLKLVLDTSFTGNDLLRIRLRDGDFGSSGFGGGPTVGPNQAALFPNQLEVAFQQNCNGNSNRENTCVDILGIQRVYYQFPIGSALTATVGGLVNQYDMLAMWPSVYPADSVLDTFNYAGAPGAYNSNLGPGVGLWWKLGNWNLSVNYVAGNGASASSGGIGTVQSAQTSTVQLGYVSEGFGVAGAYTYSRGVGVASGTPLAVLEVSAMNSIGLSTYWQPARSGWLPSISAGWGINTYPGSSIAFAIDVQESQSWYAGVQWSNVLGKGNNAGFAVGQPTFVTRCGEGCNGPPQDGQYAWEWWYAYKITDQITITPAIFYLSNLYGQLTKQATDVNSSSVSNIAALVKTTFRF
jgi:hypothetical protein